MLWRENGEVQRWTRLWRLGGSWPQEELPSMVASPKGRCAGCGLIKSVREVKLHTVSCVPFAELYQRSPEKVLSPVEEFARYQTEDRSPEALEVARQTDLDQKKKIYTELAEAKLNVARDRWGMRGQVPLRSGPSVPIDPDHVSDAVLSQVRPGFSPELEALAERMSRLYGVGPTADL